MATLITKTVKLSGGDYSSRSAFEAAQQGDLVIADEVRRAEIYNFADTTAVVVDGSTTDATRYMWFQVVAADRHAGKYFDTAKAHLTGSEDGTMVNLNDNYVVWEYDQVQNTHSYGKSFDSTAGVTSGTTVNACICKGYGSGGSRPGIGGNYMLAAVRNCVIYDFGTGIQDWYGVTSVIDNTVIFNCGTGAWRNAGTMTLRNCYVGNCTTEYTGTMTRTTCAHSSSTSYSGSTAEVAFSTANFINVTADSYDMHLTSGSALRDAGTDLSATFNTDIDGETRTGTWDIGADEYVAAGGTVYQVSTGGTISFSGSGIKQTYNILSGALSFAGTVFKLPSKIIFGVLSFLSSSAKRADKVLAGSLSFTGAISTLKVFVKSIAGTLYFGSGSLLKLANKVLSGELMFTGSMLRNSFKILSGALSFNGAVSALKTILKTVSGILSFSSGTITKIVGKAFSGSVSFAGAVMKSTSKVFSGTLSFTGSASKQTYKIIGGVLSFVGSVFVQAGSVAANLSRMVVASMRIRVILAEERLRKIVAAMRMRT